VAVKGLYNRLLKLPNFLSPYVSFSILLSRAFHASAGGYGFSKCPLLSVFMCAGDLTFLFSLVVVLVESSSSSEDLPTGHSIPDPCFYPSKLYFSEF